MGSPKKGETQKSTQRRVVLSVYQLGVMQAGVQTGIPDWNYPYRLGIEGQMVTQL